MGFMTKKADSNAVSNVVVTNAIFFLYFLKTSAVFALSGAISDAAHAEAVCAAGLPSVCNDVRDVNRVSSIPNL
jgi:hypothetical protein